MHSKHFDHDLSMHSKFYRFLCSQSKVILEFITCAETRKTGLSRKSQFFNLSANSIILVKTSMIFVHPIKFRIGKCSLLSINVHVCKSHDFANYAVYMRINSDEYIP
jgi:hypothetical protein